MHDEPPPASAIALTDARGSEHLIDNAEVASYLGAPVSTVYDWRVHGKGPAAYRFGKPLKFGV